MAQRRNKVIRIALILFGIGALYALIIRLTGIGIPCPIRRLTGTMCPGCGTTRMMMSILKLDFASAFRYNSAVFCMIPLMAATAARYSYVYIKTGKVRDRFADIAVWFMIGVLLVFGVVRNIV